MRGDDAIEDRDMDVRREPAPDWIGGGGSKEIGRAVLHLPTEFGVTAAACAVCVERLDGVKVYMAAAPVFETSDEERLATFTRAYGNAQPPEMALGLFPWLERYMRERGLDFAA